MGIEKISRFKLWQKIMSLIICSSFIWWNLAYAAPQGGQVVAGGASITQSGNLTQINQSTAKAVINWSSFDTSAVEHVNFSQPSSSAIALILKLVA